ncbi:hypothetical protein K3495_g208 [Podosphaera aphanis]|nr:hypothetical protein K3495_g208 [Podosphaera aphanis]
MSQGGSASQSRISPLTPLEKWAVNRGNDSFNAIAGSIGGFMSGLVTCPLDVIKTKLQAQGGFRNQSENNKQSTIVYRGMVGTGKVIWQREGVRGMYRGLGPIIMGYLPTWAVWFTVYGRSKQYLAEYIDSQNIVNFWSSIIAGATASTATNPIWVIKTRLMSQVSQQATTDDVRPPWQYKSTFDAARKMYKTEGLLSFYSGLTPALLGLTHVAIQFPAYEYLKIKFTGRGMGESSDGDELNHYIGVVSASLLSKIMASSATYPHEVLRTRLQTQQRSYISERIEQVGFKHETESLGNKLQSQRTPRYHGVLTTFKTILREEGWKAFYAGMGTSMMRAVPAAATTLVTFEYAMKHLREAKAGGIRKLQS